MNEFNELEEHLFEILIKKYPQFSEHRKYLYVAERKMSGKSLVTSFEYHTNDLIFSELNALFNNFEKIEIPELKQGLSYVFDITWGKIETLELSPYDEVWDGKIQDFRVVSLEI